MRKVRLTLNGWPFGREMHLEVALVYIQTTKGALKGIHCMYV